VIDAQILAFTAAALAVTVSPGPDTFLVIGNTLRGGTRVGLATVAGVISGGFFHAALFSLGVAQLLVYSPVAFAVVKLAGAFYLLYLGAKALRSALRPSTASPLVVTNAPSQLASLRGSFLQGLLTNALNPKVAIFYLAFLPQFMNPGDPVARKSALLIAIHYALGLLWLSMVAAAMGRLGRWLVRSRVRRVLDGVVGAVMTSFGVKLAFAAR
jgi:threonine/homoserine/homoserine lactone efflux protein